MIYKFKSKASGDVIMLAAHGEQMLRLLAREPSAKGIFEVSALRQTEQLLLAAIRESADAGHETAATPDDDTPAAAAITLRQRLWPFIDMLRRAQAEQVPITWGV
jgi:Domain of unknown function (DUF1840)